MCLKPIDPPSNHRVAMRNLYWLAMWLLAATIVVEYITMRWTPSSGGVAYGFPFPYIAGIDVGSHIFEIDLRPFFADIAITAVGLRAMFGWATARVGRQWLTSDHLLHQVLSSIVVIALFAVAVVGSPIARDHVSNDILQSGSVSVRPYIGSAEWIVKDRD